MGNHKTASGDRMRLYDEMKADDPVTQRCAACETSGSKHHMDRHHPRGRHGDNLFDYIYVHRVCHQQIHDNPKWAEKKGFLVRNR